MRTPELPTVLACGAWLKNTACVLVNGEPRWSQPHGDLSDPLACMALEASLAALCTLAARAGHPVRAVAHDLHPDFFSTRVALAIADALGVPAIGVQHHHAHIAAVVAEQQVEAAVIGLALDGVGLGTDGSAWGGELLWVHGADWRRLGHLAPLALPGGDRAAREPWRMAASALHALGRGDEITPRFAPQVGVALAQGVQRMLLLGLNSPLTSSAGRWFDAAAAALGLCLRQTEEAQAAQALEGAGARWLAGHPDSAPWPGARIDDLGRLDLGALWAALPDQPPQRVDEAAAGFQLGLAHALADWAGNAALAHGVTRVCLGGGCFFNRILRERVSQLLQQAGLQVLLPGTRGCGDAALALGQAWVAAQQLAAHPTNSTEISTCV